MKKRIGRVVAFIGVFGMAVAGARAGLVTNLTQHTSYTEIQAAVSAANQNDIIEVYNGTYTQVVSFAVGGVTLRAASGQTPVVSPSGVAFVINGRDDITVQGFDITGANVACAFQIQDGADRFRILDNTIHNLKIGRGYPRVLDIGNYLAGRNGLIAGNTIYDLGDGSGDYCSVVPSPYMGAPDNGTPGLVFSNNTVRNINFSYEGSECVTLFGTNMVVVNNDISQWSGGPALRICGDNTLIQNNRIHDVYPRTGQLGLQLGWGTNMVVNNNRVTANSTAFVVGLGSSMPTNAIVINNSFDAVLDVAQFYAAFWGGPGFQVSNNVFMSTRWGVNTSTKGLALTGNSMINVGGDSDMAVDDNVAIPSNVWSGNFYSYDTTGGDKGTGQAAPYTIAGAAGRVDAGALGGFWLMSSLVANSGFVVVGHAGDTNSLGQRTKATYDTAKGIFAGATNKSCFIHLAAHTHVSLAGLPARQTESAGATLRLAHTFADGTFFATVQFAYSPTPQVDASTYDLFCWNAHDYGAQSWQLAVAGNVTNAAFPVNAIQRVQGAPDSTLGHYGVDTTARVVWANVNHTSDFEVFGKHPSRGTAISIRPKH